MPSILIVVVQLAVGVIAQAQQSTKILRIGFLIATSPSTSTARMEYSVRDICGYRAFVQVVSDKPQVIYHFALLNFGTSYLT